MIATDAAAAALAAVSKCPSLSGLSNEVVNKMFTGGIGYHEGEKDILEKLMGGNNNLLMAILLYC